MSSKEKMKKFDVIVLGGGAAGLMAAAAAANRGKRVLVLEVSNKLGKKILMSGGGRCNFTNLEVKAEHFLSDNPHFVKSALSQYTNWDFIGMVAAYGIDYHEKDHGQLFCDGSAKEILAMLVKECEKGDVEFQLNANTDEIEVAGHSGCRFKVVLENEVVYCRSLIVATGGLSIPTLGGATGLGYRIAEQFNLKVLPRAASLVPFTLSGKLHEFVSTLSGVSLTVMASVPTKQFYESMLFTHRGLSGPSILQLSNYWDLGCPIQIDLLPNQSVAQELQNLKKSSPRKTINNYLVDVLPKSVVRLVTHTWFSDISLKPLQEVKNSELIKVGEQLNCWSFTPSGTEGYRTAEVTRGGVSVDQISSKTMEHKDEPGLFFVGEVLDVTGHLGGYNFQWAWSSGYVAGMNA